VKKLTSPPDKDGIISLHKHFGWRSSQILPDKDGIISLHITRVLSFLMWNFSLFFSPHHQQSDNSRVVAKGDNLKAIAKHRNHVSGLQ
jgi:hypothetical protein